MDFIRKNWSRLSIALLFLLGGILGIVAFANSGVFTASVSWQQRFFDIVALISVLVYFLGMVAVMVLKSCAGKKAVSIAYMVTGGIVFIANIVLLFACLNNDEVISLIGNNAVVVFFQYIVPTIVFGFYPLIKGTTRFIEAEMTPLPVKPAAQPAAAAETPAQPAEKPAAKKTAKPAAK